MTRRERTDYLSRRKRETVGLSGCSECGTGKWHGGFEWYWGDQEYDARRFVLRYADPRESDVPVANLSRIKTATEQTINEALARCVILCRSCFSKQSQKEMTQCQETTTTTSPSNL